MSIETSGAPTPLIKNDSVRALAVKPAKRSAFFPDLPTLADRDCQDSTLSLGMDSWFRRARLRAFETSFTASWSRF
jgi:hypothetical protein